MWKFETYTKRLKRHEQAGKADVYQYETLPRDSRIQVIHIWHTAIGPYYADSGVYAEKTFSNRSWETVHDSLCRESGVFNLGEEGHNPFAQCQEYLLGTDTNGALDIIEWAFRWIDTAVRKLGKYQMDLTGIKQEPDDANGELNLRFREHQISYQFAGGEIVRVDSQYIHSEVVKPAIDLLRHADFQGASDEFLKAHEHYRHGRYKEAVSEALKAFESTMKIICDARMEILVERDGKNAHRSIDPERSYSNGSGEPFRRTQIGTGVRATDYS